jgi:hypothetical protein
VIGQVQHRGNGRRRIGLRAQSDDHGGGRSRR